MRLILCFLLSTAPLIAQETLKANNTVAYVAEPQKIAAGTKAMVELHFKVAEGYHVNSHTPKSDYLIPTTVKAESAPGVQEGALVYATGKEFSFSFSPNEKLDVYSGEFTVKLPVVAEAGEHTIAATLHYQACDHAACYPPKSLPLQVLFTAK